METIEKTHPLKSTSEAIPKTEFLLAHQKYAAILRDGHMGYGLITNTSMYIDIKWVSVDSKLYLATKDGKPSDIEVTMIGGIPTSEVMKQVAIYYGSENDAALQSHYRPWRNYISRQNGL